MARSVFYYHLKHLKSKDKYEDERKSIRLIFYEHKGRYGYRRVTAEMRNRGYKINHKTVQRLMNEMGLKVSIRPTTGIKPLYTTIATVTMNLIVSAAIVLLNPYVTVYISYKIPPFALSVHIPDVSTSIYVEVDSKVLLGLPSCDKAFVR